MTPDAIQRTRSRRTLMLIFGICLAPIVASYTAFYLWQPGGRVNHGDLVDPPQAQLWVAAQPALRGKWVMALAASATCDENCRQSLYYMRQVRVAQSQEMDRVARAWVVTDDSVPDANALKDQEGLVVLHDAQLAHEADSARIMLIDPLGNLMMRFPAAPNPKAMVSDLNRLLQYSSLGKK